DSRQDGVCAPPVAPERHVVVVMGWGGEGGSGALGHPNVYLNLGDGGQVDCPYCGRRFVLKEGAAPAHHH
ncbi:MAG: zinc-finger domain-containing protein, partial [Rickettsiales bacterium]